MTALSHHWLSDVNVDELEAVVPGLVLLRSDPSPDLDAIAQRMAGDDAEHRIRRSFAGNARRNVPPPLEFWAAVRAEFRTFLCTNDRKYAALKRELNAKRKRSSVVVLTLISAALAEHVGTAAGVIVPFCALCLAATVRIGVQAYCRMTEGSAEPEDGQGR